MARDTSPHMDVVERVEHLKQNIRAAEEAERWSDAARFYDQLMPLVKPDAGTIARHALIVLHAGEPARAATMTRKARRLDPDNPRVGLQLAEIYKAQNRIREAEKVARDVLARHPDNVEAMRLLAHVIQGDSAGYDEAEQLLLKVVDADPENVTAMTQLAAIYSSRPDRLVEAAEIFRQSIERHPNSPSLVHNYGLICRMLGHLDEALVYLQRAVELRPDSANFVFSLGICYLFMEEMERALELFEKSAKIDPYHNASQVYIAFALLLMGRYEQGWRQYEKRLKLDELKEANYARPRWNGEPLDGETILLLCEQGMGDNIHFIRYAKNVAARGGTVIALTHKSLLRLFQSASGVAHVANVVPAPKNFHRYSPLMSLPYVFGTTAETIPAEVPYLRAPDDLIASWRERMEVFSGPRVGLNWRGNPRHVNDRFRSSSLDEMAQLMDVPGITFFCLQKQRPEHEQTLPAGMVDLTDQFEDYADTAAMMEQLDLVISVDTSVCHLAGAIGRPVWTMLPRGPDFRWGLGGETTPWYPTMKLYRQPTLCDWQSVYERMKHDLQALARG